MRVRWKRVFELVDDAFEDSAVPLFLVPLDSWLAKSYGILSHTDELFSVRFKKLAVMLPVYSLSKLAGVKLEFVFNLLKLSDHELAKPPRTYGKGSDDAMLVIGNCPLEQIARSVGIEAHELSSFVKRGLDRYLFIYLDDQLACQLAKPVTVAPLIAAYLAYKDKSYADRFARLIENATVAVKYPMVAHFNAIFAYYYSVKLATDDAVMKIFSDKPVPYISARTLSKVNISAMMHSAVRTVVEHFGFDILRFMYSCDYNFQWWMQRWREIMS